MKFFKSYNYQGRLLANSPKGLNLGIFCYSISTTCFLLLTILAFTTSKLPLVTFDFLVAFQLGLVRVDLVAW